MEKLWRKARRTVGAVLAFAMLASVTAAPALADAEPSAADNTSSSVVNEVESTSSNSDPASSDASSASSDSDPASSDASSASSDSDPASSDASSASSDSDPASSDASSASSSTEAGSQDAQVYSDVAGTPNMLSGERFFGWGDKDKEKNTFINNTQDEHVRIYYSTDGKHLKRITNNGGSIEVLKSDVAVEFYIVVDEGYNYWYTDFGFPWSGTVQDLSNDKDLGDLKEPSGKKFDEAIQAALDLGATRAFLYSGVSLNGYCRTFNVHVCKDYSYVEITYVNTATDAEWTKAVKRNTEANLWNGVDEVNSVDWTLDNEHHQQLVGWSECENATTKQYDLGEKISTRCNKTLYTVWAPAQYEYTVEYYYNGKLGVAPEYADQGGSAEYNTTVTTKPQQIIAMWVDGESVTYTLDEDASTLSTAITENKEDNVLKVYYVSLNNPDQDDKYVSLTFDAGEHGKIVSDEGEAIIRNMSLKQGDNYPEAPDVTPATGWVFTGWYDQDGNKYDFQGEVPELEESVAYKYTASYVKEESDEETPAALTSYTVRYLEDGTGYEVASSKTVTGVRVGATVTETAPDIAGYTVTSDKNPQTFTVGSGDNIIYFYYKAVGPDQTVVTPSDTTTTTPAAPAAPVTPRITTPAAGGTATGTAGTTGPSVTAAPADGEGDNAAEEPAEEEVVPEEETPQAQEPADESIADEETPLAGSTASGWALLNLILAILTVIGAIVLVVGYFAGYQNIWRLLSLVPAIGGLVAFFLTEDMSQPMAFVDGWTVLMVIIAIVQIVVAVMALKNKDEDEDENA